MGIKNIKKIIREKCNAIWVYPLSSWRGQKIAIDISIIMHAQFSSAWKEVVTKTNIIIDEPNMEDVNKIWLRNMKGFLWRFLSLGITLILVFDGKPPQEKIDITISKRKIEKQKRQDKFKSLKETIDKKDFFLVDSNEENELQKSILQIAPLSKDHFEIFKSILDGIGRPFVQAIGEAEEVCSNLYKNGKVAAVFSTDTDNLAHGCSIL